eukprot:6187657-Pleurochrysis_carterae.AAC.1
MRARASIDRKFKLHNLAGAPRRLKALKILISPFNLTYSAERRRAKKPPTRGQVREACASSV